LRPIARRQQHAARRHLPQLPGGYLLEHGLDQALLIIVARVVGVSRGGGVVSSDEALLHARHPQRA
jgi:hypothetical protein